MRRLLFRLGLLLASLSLPRIAPAQTSRPAGDDQADVTVDGPASVTIDDNGVHVRPATQPTTRATRGGNIRIHLSGNSFGGNGRGSDVGKPIAARDAGKPTDNPLAKLGDDGVAIFKRRNVDIAAMQRMKAVLITDAFTGARRREIVNDDPNLVIVFGKGFATHGSVTSAGPIVATDDANFMGAIKSDSLVWFTGNSMPRGETSGSPVICAPKLYIGQAHWTCPEVWIGEYGWPP